MLVCAFYIISVTNGNILKQRPPFFTSFEPVLFGLAHLKNKVHLNNYSCLIRIIN